MADERKRAQPSPEPEKSGAEGRHDEHGHHPEQGHHHPEHHRFEIQIDRTHYEIKDRHMTGEQLRHVPTPPIGPDRDLFEVVPGGSDRKIGDHEVVEIRNGLRFFAAPAQINPGHLGRPRELCCVAVD